MIRPNNRARLGVICGLLALTAVVIGACVPPHEVAVYNNTGGDIVLRIEPAFFWHVARYKRIPPGHLAIGYQQEMLPPGLVIPAGSCTLG